MAQDELLGESEHYLGSWLEDELRGELGGD